MNEVARNKELARRRANYRRRQDERSSIPDESNPGNSDFAAPTTMIQESTHNIGENLVDVTIVRQTYRSELISLHTLTSNFERGTVYHRQILFIKELTSMVITNIQGYPRPRQYHNITRNFGENDINYE
ncbi:uncharacterized protein LOC142541371 [Primulina tabacum]|uniref:uncharacterized protein LOC142541371 n=1 Tax=Primulina tabacum TaxID=48773 RepID=UPI003F596A7D